MTTSENVVLFEETGRVSVSTACLKECGPEEIVPWQNAPAAYDAPRERRIFSAALDWREEA